MKYGHIATFLFGTIFILGSCVKENLSPGSSVPDGEPATISLKVSTSDMDIVTRALTDEQLQQVNDIWIGVYNVKTEELTGSYTEDNNTDVAETNYKEVTIDAASGNSYIVAVANVKRNYGVTDNPTLEEDCIKNKVYRDEESGRYQLLGMLENADTWEKFKSISAAWNTPGALDLVTTYTPMYGHYSDKGPDNNTAHDYEDIKSVTIKPGTENSLTGAIHLRSLYSYITFNVTAQNAAYEDFTFEPLSWQVFNVPTISYLYEGNKANSADLIVINDTVITDETGSYGTSKASTTFDYTNAAKENSYTFDFYLFENKHTGTADTYEEREREYKTDGLNTGIYKSLVSEEKYEQLDGRLGSVRDRITNNFATYVQLKAYITYTTKDDIPRAGYATYVIHLGYVGNDATDFNVHRHTKYTYNVTIKDINSIVVEAKKGDERPDTEGDVTDATTAAFDLDAHFCVFNIKLSNRDRYELNYRIRAPYGDDVVDLRTSRTFDHGFEKPAFANNGNENYKFYSWIEFKPVATTDEHILAVYNSTKDNVLRMYLEELRETVKREDGTEVLRYIHPLDAKNGDIDDDTPYYYTVFVNEYVYEDENGDETGDNWVNYVNKDNRAIWLILQETDISEDTESVYTNAAYLFNQKSIMTYYDLNNLTASQTAVGVEQVNENYGLNMIWTVTDTPSYTENGQTYNTGWSSTNGRWNVMEYMDQVNKRISWQTYANTTANSTNITVKYYDEDGTIKYGNDGTLTENEETEVFYIDQMYVPAIDRQNESRSETYPALYSPISMNRTTSDYTPNNSSTYYEIMEACLMRNRDENGNGIIDDKELKWYLPTSGKYVGILLGESGFPMSARLMNFSSVESLFYGAGATENWRYHYATSDRMFIWAEEGMASANITVNSSIPWQLRCIRNLGTDLSENIEKYDMTDVVEYAYQHDSNNHTIKPTYYNSNVKRQPVTNSLVVHKINDEANLLGMYGFEYYKDDIQLAYNVYDQTLIKNWVSNSQTICDQLNTDTERPWRVPNQKEVTIMRRCGVLVSNNYVNTPMWCSCTTEYFGSASSPGTEHVETYYNNGFYYRFMKASPSITTAGYGNSYYVRCVRDLAN